MRIDIITVLPEMIEGFFNCSIMSRAQKKVLPKFIFIIYVIMRMTAIAKLTTTPLADVQAW